MKNAELNYSVHEKELLAIIRALKKWRTDLLGSPFYVYTDHKTLLNFNTQKDLSRRQARWMEDLASFDCKFVYIKGENNTVADALSRYPFQDMTSSQDAELHASPPFASTSAVSQSLLHINTINTHMIAAAIIAMQPSTQTTPSNSSSLQINHKLITKLKASYKNDKWCMQLKIASKGMNALTFRDGLWFINNRLIIPAALGLCEHIFHLAHDTLGHFGSFKTYKSIQDSYYWPGMRKDLEEGYIPTCIDCQQFKSHTSNLLAPYTHFLCLTNVVTQSLWTLLDLYHWTKVSIAFSPSLTDLTQNTASYQQLLMPARKIRLYFFLTVGTVKMDYL